MRQYLSSVIDHVEPYVSRFYYLYEDNPHLFFALELRDKSFNGRVSEILTDHYKPAFIKRSNIRFETNEQSNGDFFLDIISSYCKSLLKYPEEGSKQQIARIKGLSKLHHLTHCIFDMVFGSREEELDFYKDQLKFYRKSGRTIRPK